MRCILYLMFRDVQYTWDAELDGAGDTESPADAEHAAGTLHAEYDAVYVV